jgi:Domain of unknown function (DUF2017)
VGHDAAGLTGVVGLPPRVARLDDGRIAFLLSPAERVILGGYVEGLRDRVTPRADDAVADDDTGKDAAFEPEGATPATRDPVLARLYPDAIPADPAASASYRDLVVRDLAGGRLAALDTVARTLDATTLDDAQAGAWLGALNDLRLVIGTDLDVREDDPDDIKEHDPDAERRLVYGFAAWLQGQLVDVLAEALPFVAEDAADHDDESRDGEADEADDDDDEADADAGANDDEAAAGE